MDRLIGGAMTHSLEMGVYPVAAGSHQIFINSRPNLERGSFMPRPQAVIIVGLGEEGKLRPADLVQSVRQAVIGWAQRMAENRKNAPKMFELSATLLGSGGAGVTAADAARLVAQGVYEANHLLQTDVGDDRNWPRVSHLQIHRALPGPRDRRVAGAADAGRRHAGPVRDRRRGEARDRAARSAARFRLPRAPSSTSSRSRRSPTRTARR